MNVRITPMPLSGEIAAIPSKSDAHRLLILSALSYGTTHVLLRRRSDDIDAPIGCLRALGAQIETGSDGIIVHGIRRFTENPLLNCRESGSTLRFLLPVAAVHCDTARFTAAGRLPERPIGELTRAMRSHGVRFSSDRLPFSTAGRLTGAITRCRGTSVRNM
jgi:3-phosphoshikimate 1-carboxyvinyltransferase